MSDEIYTDIVFPIVTMNGDKKEDLTKPLEEFIDYRQHVHIINKTFDAVLIDGRARSYCAKEILPYLKKNAVVFIHDYFKRPFYHWIENFYHIIDKVNSNQSLVVLKKRTSILDKQLDVESFRRKNNYIL